MHTLHALQEHWVAVAVALGLLTAAVSVWMVVKMRRFDRQWDRLNEAPRLRRRPLWPRA